jgi:chromosome segregation ATPase
MLTTNGKVHEKDSKLEELLEAELDQLETMEDYQWKIDEMEQGVNQCENSLKRIRAQIRKLAN